MVPPFRPNGACRPHAPALLLSALTAAGLACGLVPAARAAGPQTERQIDRLASGWRGGEGAVAPGAAGTVVMMYGETQPVLKCKVLNICVIRLQPGERPTEVPTLGDAVRWTAQYRAGDVDGEQTVYVVVKPASTAQKTSLFLVTDRRSYDIELVPSYTHWTPMLAFRYPEAVAAANRAVVARLAKGHRARTRAATAHAIVVNGRQVPASKLDFDYKIRGQAPFRPARVFNDGHMTYVDLPPDYAGPLPVFLELTGPGKGKGAIVNYRIAKTGGGGRRFVIDDLAQSGELTLGVGGRAETVRFQRGG